MIVQHNLLAMNANRNLGIIAGSQSKSTEKLSSGYRINRAADDAAGLSISEKMRGQIRGLNQASTNAQDGISLIQTAEGALNESHAILQRMRELSVQAANGTETDDDREAVQNEISQLQDELTRIADTTEFNTMKLLDGTLGGGSSVDGVEVNAKVSVAKSAALTTTAAVKGVYSTDTSISADDDEMLKGDTTSITVNYLNENGEQESLTITLTYKDKNTMVAEDGKTEYTAADGSTSGGGATQAQKTAAFLAELKKTALADNFNITAGTNGFDFSAKTAGTDAPRILSVLEANTKSGVYTQVGTVAAAEDTPPADTYQSITNAVGSYDGATTSDIDDYIFEVNGEKFMYATAAGVTALKGMQDYSDVNYIVAAGASATNTEAKSMAELINAKTGINATVTGSATTIDLKPATDSTTAGKDGLMLQIGANEGQTMTFSIGDMSAKALGVAGNKINIATQDTAKVAMTTIDEAIKKVSEQRSKLGAVQNRLEHTIANLDTSAENLQAAESRIRDVDMADEMVTYSKNNILQQAAQSMLAQANQSTQGVLSLLQ